jgi:hypothetical protein
VEFFGVDGFVGRNRDGFGRVGCWFDHGEAPYLYLVEPPTPVAKQVRVAAVRGLANREV